ncbi:hypothetical protein ACFQO8_09320 [Exiguobacterium aestuarii]|uniref:Uncharacterized protein n=1 Tax=Exiguobacterium aestuarii TaxID=273527 RepID=A0ABW2PLM2_9BACL|nr:MULTISPECIES: hypothetical protein [Exiguobacterium]MCT4785226.1 hypothetical protein [Exiguobacterium aestuarii]
MKREHINYPMILKSAKDMDFKKIIADTLDFGISSNLSFPLPARAILDHCETFLQSLRVNYLDVLMAKVYIDCERDQDYLKELFSQLTKNEALIAYIGRASEVSKQTHSNQATILLGIYSGQIVVKPELLENHISIVMLEILSSLNDTDINHFCLLYDFLICNPESDIVSHQAYYGFNEMKHGSFLKEQIQVDPNLVSYFTSANKFINLGLISKGASTWGAIDNFIVTTNIYSTSLKDLILEYEELSKYKISP